MVRVAVYKYLTQLHQPSDQKVDAIALNIYIPRLEPKREIGFFIENISGQRQEYTLWLENSDNVDRMYLRLRTNANVTDYELLIINNLRTGGTYLRPYYQFAIQIFFEIDNSGLDILYLREGPAQQDVETEKINPNEMKRIDNAVLPTINNIQKIGLIGYGGETQIVIWPFSFFIK